MDVARINAAKSGDKRALEELVVEYEVRIRLYAARLMPGHSTADDIAQETFVTALKHLDRYDASYDFGSWLRGITRNLALREWRRISTLKSHTETLARHVQMLAEEESNAEDVDSRLDALRNCIQSLPEKSGQLLQMVYELGFSHKDIAGKIQCSLDAVKQAVSRLRFKLRECVEDKLSKAVV
jgi:RNA polymerase sigma-70 factor, ECF subfamily